MRILHTADWHFGKTLEGRDRFPEQVQFVDELCQMCEDERIDMVLMAGDVYQTVNPSAQAEELYYDVLTRLAGNGKRAVVIIAGNHDHPERIAAPQPLADSLGITLMGLPKDDVYPSRRITPGQVYRRAAGPSWLEVVVPGCDDAAVIAAVPYPSEARLKEVLSKSLDETEMASSYNERMRFWFAHLSQHFRSDTINLAMSHLFVRGGMESDSEIQIQVGGTYAVDAAIFPEQAQYVALGHLHRPQMVQGAKVPVRYAGSPLAYSFSEIGYAKSVTILDAVPGKAADVQERYLSSGKPLVKWSAREGLSQVIRWVEEGKDANSWIDLEIHMNEAIRMEDIFLLRGLHDGFVHIRPVMTSVREEISAGAMSKLPIDELFVRFYERQKGMTPDEGLIEAFLNLVSDDEPDEATTEPSEEVAG